MKITPRLLVILACAWCGLPLLGIALHPVDYVRLWTQAPLNVVIVIVRMAFLAIGWGAYARRDWVRRAATALAIGWTAVMGALAAFTPFGMLAIMLVARSVSSLFKDDAATAGIATLVAAFWGLLAWAWVVAIGARRLRPEQPDSPKVLRSVASRDVGENRLVYGGVALIAAWLIVWPFVHDAVSPLREIRPGMWTSDAAHARVLLTDAQRQAMSPADLHVVDDINDDIAHILAAQPPTHSSIEVHGPSTWYTAEPGHAWYIVAHSRDGGVAQVNVEFYNGDLAHRIGGRTILIR